MPLRPEWVNVEKDSVFVLQKEILCCVSDHMLPYLLRSDMFMKSGSSSFAFRYNYKSQTISAIFSFRIFVATQKHTNGLFILFEEFVHVRRENGESHPND